MSPALPELPHGGQNPQQQQAVDMEALAHYILSSPQFQQMLITGTQDKGQLESALLQQEQLHQMSMKVRVLLSRAHALCSTYTVN
jgi:hypothetical protein